MKSDQEIDCEKKHRASDIYYPLLGVSMPLCICLGFLLGRFLDARFHTAPLFLILLTLFGVIAGFMQLFKTNKRN